MSDDSHDETVDKIERMYTNKLYDSTRFEDEKGLQRQLGLFKTFSLGKDPVVQVDFVHIKQPTVYLPKPTNLPEIVVGLHPYVQQFVPYLAQNVTKGDILTCYSGFVDKKANSTGDTIKSFKAGFADEILQHNSIFAGGKLNMPVTIYGSTTVEELLRGGLVGQIIPCKTPGTQKNCAVSCYFFTKDGIDTRKPDVVKMEYFDDDEQKFQLMTAGPEKLKKGFLGVAVVWKATRDISMGRPLISSHKWEPVDDESFKKPILAPIFDPADLANLIWLDKHSRVAMSMLVVGNTVFPKHVKVSAFGEHAVVAFAGETHWKIPTLEEWRDSAITGLPSDPCPQIRAAPDTSFPKMSRVTKVRPPLDVQDDTSELMRDAISSVWLKPTELKYDTDEDEMRDPETGDYVFSKDLEGSSKSEEETPRKRLRKQADPMSLADRKARFDRRRDAAEGW